MTRSGKRTLTFVAIAAVMVAIIALNTILAFALRSARIDLTDRQLYSVSPGMKELMGRLDEKVRVRLFWSESVGGDLPQYKMLATRVREFLEEISRASGGKIDVRVIDPRPFSEEEDAARAAGLAVRPVDAVGATLTLGLVIEGPTDKVEVMPAINPEDETFLEYEIARRILSVARTERPIVAVLSSIPETPPFNPRNPRGSAPPRVITELRALFDVRYIEIPLEGPPVVPEDATTLILIQPRGWPEATLRFIDQWAVAGKPILALLDPWSEFDPAAQAAAGGMGGAQGTTFELDPLLASWGIELGRGTGSPDSIYVVGDQTYATRVNARTSSGAIMQLPYLPWLSLTEAAFVPDDPVGGSLAVVNLMSAGSLKRRADATTTVTPIMRSSVNSQLVPTMQLGLAGEPDQLIKNFVSTNEEQWLAVRIGGPITSAFPDGASGSAATGDANIIIIADADLLSDDTWGQEQRFGNQSLGFVAFADNAGLILNAVETLSGDRALASLRGRGEYRRPFQRVEAIRRDAEANYLEEERRLEEELRISEQKIAQLQREKTAGGGNALVLSAEQQDELKRLQAAATESRKKLRAVQLKLGEDVARLGRTLVILNVVLWPAFIALGALSLYLGRLRRHRSRTGRSTAGGAA